MNAPLQLDAAKNKVFGARLELAEAYHDLLAGPGSERGFIGPREADRLWQRHLLNCAVVGEAIASSARVIDVGSGADLESRVVVRVPRAEGAALSHALGELQRVRSARKLDAVRVQVDPPSL